MYPVSTGGIWARDTPLSELGIEKADRWIGSPVVGQRSSILLLRACDAPLGQSLDLDDARRKSGCGKRYRFEHK